ncbi:hypothetical protein [Frankia sp. CiP3]|uniref:hypothetical protein n=1 Tax=Frankia sp. CiP3 TaxID=2880971 RepID=UPI001EF542EE|nr:hypothetical protein [Frankia sp. CiP3]
MWAGVVVVPVGLRRVLRILGVLDEASCLKGETDVEILGEELSEGAARIGARESVSQQGARHVHAV